MPLALRTSRECCFPDRAVDEHGDIATVPVGVLNELGGRCAASLQRLENRHLDLLRRGARARGVDDGLCWATHADALNGDDLGLWNGIRSRMQFHSAGGADSSMLTGEEEMDIVGQHV